VPDAPLSDQSCAPSLRTQATFLRGSTASDLPDNPELRAQLEALSPEELEMRCRRSGLSRRGTAADQVRRPQATLGDIASPMHKLLALRGVHACMLYRSHFTIVMRGYYCPHAIHMMWLPGDAPADAACVPQRRPEADATAAATARAAGCSERRRSRRRRTHGHGNCR
jgi:hypothetical protein